MNHVHGAGAPTLADVATAAGVSAATASRVLNGSTRRVATVHVDHVRAAAAQLGYTANLAAQATARGTASVVALLVADIADPYFGQIAAGVARGADEAGFIMTIAITERDPRREARLVLALRGMRPRGLILAASRTAEPAPELEHALEDFQAAGGTVVALGPGAGDVRSVDIDNRGGAAALAQTLSGLGYRRAIVLAAPAGVRSSDDRIAGFADGFARGGGVVDQVYRRGYTRQDGQQMMAEALTGQVAAGTLVFGVSDVVAVGAMSALQQAGRRIGPDIAVAGFDDTATGRDITPSLTTVHIPLEEVGYQALHATVDEDWAADPARMSLSVVLRDSTPRRG